METFNQLNEVAVYIDEGIKHLQDVTESDQWMSVKTKECDLINTLNQSISEHFQEISKLTVQVNSLAELNSTVENAKYALNELKKYGILCGLPFSMSQQKPIIDNSQQNASSIKQSQVEEKHITPIPKQSLGPVFKEITLEEFQTLPSIIPLLIKIEDMNKYYQNLFQYNNTKISANELSEIVPLTSSRLNAFTRALTSLNRVQSFEDDGITFYTLL